MKFIYAFLILLGVITIHEFGHFIAARIVGVRVKEFSIGIGPKLYQNQGVETLFSIRALPLGGYCRFDDEEDEEDLGFSYKSSDKVDYEDASNGKKLIILISGILMNMLTALLILFLLFSFYGYPSTYVEKIVPGSVAEEVGIQEGDHIVKIDGIKVNTASELMATEAYENKKYTLTVIRNGEELLIPIVSEDGKIGVYFAVRKNPGIAIKQSFNTAGMFISEIFKAIKEIFVGKSDNLMGVVGFVATVGTMQGINLNVILMIIVNISISLAVFNLLPIAPLDGGQILIVLIESIIGRELSEKAKTIIMSIGVVFILYIFIRSLMNDFSRF